jgi:hypothetical protein
MLAIIFAASMISPRSTAAQPPGVAGSRAEIQIGLCAPADKIVRALNLRPRGTPVTVWLFDDSALTLFQRGVRLRLRAADGPSEFTLKVADQDCAQLNLTVPSRGAKCEYDVHGTTMAGAVSLTRKVSARITRDVVAGRMMPAQVLSQSQITYLREVVGLWPLPVGLEGLGPTQVQAYRAAGDPYDVNISQLPGGEQYIEISRKVAVADATRAMALLQAHLSGAGVEVCADQSGQAVNKLRTLLR